MTEAKGSSRSTLVSDSSIEEQKAKRLPQYLATFSATLAGFADGNVLGWTSPANPKLRDDTDIGLSEDDLSWIGAVMALGALAATLPAGQVMELIGRKRSMLVLIIPFVVGWALLAFHTNAAMLFAGRFITGICAGAYSIIVPVYIGEVTEKSIRGRLTGSFEVMITGGILFTYVVGSYVSVMVLCILCGIVPIVFGVTFFFMPESPVYYLKKDRHELAVESLKFLRGPDYDLQPEIEEMEEYLRENEGHKISLDMLLTKAAVRAGVISYGIMFFQQLGGINAAIFYTQDIFSAAQVELDEAISSIIVGIALMSSAYVSTILVDHAGRKSLLAISCAVSGISAAFLGVYFYLMDNNGKESVKDFGWLPLTSMAIYIIANEIGLGPMGWVINGEVFPPEIKGFGGSVSCLINWTLVFVVTKFYGDMATAWGRGVTFWIFAGICFLGLVFMLTVVIETKNKSLEEIQRELSGKPRKDTRINQTEKF